MLSRVRNTSVHNVNISPGHMFDFTHVVLGYIITGTIQTSYDKGQINYAIIY